MNSSETSAKYSWPNSEQKEEIQDSGVPEEDDIMSQEGEETRGGGLWGMGSGWSSGSGRVSLFAMVDVALERLPTRSKGDEGLKAGSQQAQWPCLIHLSKSNWRKREGKREKRRQQQYTI